MHTSPATIKHPTIIVMTVETQLYFKNSSCVTVRSFCPRIVRHSRPAREAEKLALGVLHCHARAGDRTKSRPEPAPAPAPEPELKLSPVKSTHTKEYAPKFDPTARVYTAPYSVRCDTGPDVCSQYCKTPFVSVGNVRGEGGDIRERRMVAPILVPNTWMSAASS